MKYTVTNNLSLIDANLVRGLIGVQSLALVSDPDSVFFDPVRPEHSRNADLVEQSRQLDHPGFLSQRYR